jgi:hypothetical protein
MAKHSPTQHDTIFHKILLQTSRVISRRCRIFSGMTGAATAFEKTENTVFLAAAAFFSL